MFVQDAKNRLYRFSKQVCNPWHRIYQAQDIHSHFMMSCCVISCVSVGVTQRMRKALPTLSAPKYTYTLGNIDQNTENPAHL